MEITGKIKLIGQPSTYGDNGFTKREIVITTEEQYPQHILVEFVQDKCSLLDKFSVGQNVTVGINLRGREWTDPKSGTLKHFNTVQGWRIQESEGSQGGKQINNAQNKQPKQAQLQDDGLPF